MKSFQTPEASIQSEPDHVVVSPSTHVSQGGGPSTPGWCESPALTADGEASRHTNTNETNNLFTFESPLGKRVDGDGRVPAVTLHLTHKQDADVVRFCALTDRKDYDGAIQLCRERLLTARDRLTSLRWNKDRAIVEAKRGDFLSAYDLLAGSHWLASEVEGTPRAKYENEFGIVLARLGRSSLALNRFNVAYQNHRKTENLLCCAQVDHNRARALMTRGETAKAQRYLKRALDYARANNDFRLEMEICQSVVEFGLTEGAR